MSRAWVHCPECGRAITSISKSTVYLCGHCRRWWLVEDITTITEESAVAQRARFRRLRQALDELADDGLAHDLPDCVHENAVPVMDVGWWCPECGAEVARGHGSRPT